MSEDNHKRTFSLEISIANESRRFNRSVIHESDKKGEKKDKEFS